MQARIVRLDDVMAAIALHVSPATFPFTPRDRRLFLRIIHARSSSYTMRDHFPAHTVSMTRIKFMQLIFDGRTVPVTSHELFPTIDAIRAVGGSEVALP